MRLSALVLVGCGGVAPSTPPVVEAHPTSNATDEVVAARDTAITRDHAQRIAAGAIAWRRAHGGQCPTTTNVIETYTFTAGVEKDASGVMLVLECSGPEIRVLSSGQLAYVERDEPPPSDAASVSPAIAARLKACQDLALRTHPSATGAIHGELVIAPNGIVKQVVVDSKRSTVDSPELLRCVQTKLKGVASEVETRGKETRVGF